MLILRAICRLIGVVFILISFVVIVIPIAGLLDYFRNDPRRSLALGCQQAMSKIALWIVNTEIRHDIDIKNFEPQGQLIIANHVSYFDVLCIASILPMSFLGKSEIRKWPLIRNLGSAARAIYVVRDSMQSRVACLLELKRELKSRNYTLFPEGTTTTSVYPTAEKWFDGFAYIAAQKDLNVWALCIEYDRHEDRAWVDDMDLISHFWRTVKGDKLIICVKAKKLDCAQGQKLRPFSRKVLADLKDDCIRTQEQLNDSLTKERDSTALTLKQRRL